MITLIELSIGFFIVLGFINEKKLIAFEDRVGRAVRRFIRKHFARRRLNVIKGNKFGRCA